jgi:hypothetical protein
LFYQAFDFAGVALMLHEPLVLEVIHQADISNAGERSDDRYQYQAAEQQHLPFQAKKAVLGDFFRIFKLRHAFMEFIFHQDLG